MGAQTGERCTWLYFKEGFKGEGGITTPELSGQCKALDVKLRPQTGGDGNTRRSSCVGDGRQCEKNMMLIDI